MLFIGITLIIVKENEYQVKHLSWPENEARSNIFFPIIDSQKKEKKRKEAVMAFLWELCLEVGKGAALWMIS